LDDVSAPRLIVLDSVMIDVLVKVSELPVLGSDSLASDALVSAGGGFTVACAAHRHGLAALYAGRLGRGPLSEVARAALRREEVAAPVDADPDHDAGFCLVIVDAQGERTFVTAKGAELSLRRRDLDVVAVEPGDIVYVSGYNLVYPEVGESVGQWLADLGDEVTVAFDPGARVADIPESLVASTLARTDWLLCNVHEARALSGETAIGPAGDVLLARTGGRGVVIHDGPHGCWVVTATQPCVRVAGFVTRVVDTNGAGDTHNGVFLAELSRGGDVLEAARRANGAAAMAVAQLGPATSPTHDELTAWFASFTEQD
jgi:sugar/nucleoside kinase (ribokinase family)